jgi:pimeloyl-ACP methyl ester carboxylesterase
MKTTHSKDGTPLAYDIYGEGTPLIFITGATCFRNFEPVLHDATIFAKAFTVYNYDRRGRGDSGDTLPYAPKREVEDIEAMIDAAGGKAVLYGHSSGAILALEAALQLGDKVEKLVLYDPAHADNEDEGHDFRAFSQTLKEMVESGKHGEAISLFLETIGMPKEMIEGMPHSAQWETITALAPTLVYDTLLASDLPPLERAAHLATPTLLIVGENSPPSLHAVATQLNGALPNVTYKLLEGQDHVADPESLLPILTDFLKG